MSIWLIINLIIAAAVIALFAYGYHIDRSENQTALVCWMFAIIVLVIAAVSEIARWIFT